MVKTLLPREMENICRGSNFGDFVTILTERLMQGVTVVRSRAVFTAIVITRKIVQCHCVHRVVYTLYSFSTTVISVDMTKRESALYSSNLATMEQPREYRPPSLPSVKYNVLCKSLSQDSQNIPDEI